MITNQNDIIIRAALTALEQPEFTHEILVPLLECSGTEARFCDVLTSRKPQPQAFEEFGKDLVQCLTTMSLVEIVVATHTRPAMVQYISEWLAKNHPEVIARVSNPINEHSHALWFRFDDGPNDIRKINVIGFGERPYKGISCDVLYVVNRGTPEAPAVTAEVGASSALME